MSEDPERWKKKVEALFKQIEWQGEELVKWKDIIEGLRETIRAQETLIKYLQEENRRLWDKEDLGGYSDPV